MTVRVEHDDCLLAIPRLVAEGVECDAVVTDPPYGLEFMGQEWDKFRTNSGSAWAQKRATGKDWKGQKRERPGRLYMRSSHQTCRSCGRQSHQHNDKVCVADYELVTHEPLQMRSFQEWCEGWGREAYAILRPGGFLVAFGGTRTYHRMVSGLEDAGFVIQDTVAWLYGSGFPKNKAHLKPAFEPICLAYKPGGKRTMQVDECRIGVRERPKITDPKRTSNVYGQINNPGGRLLPDGRWPANVAHDGSDEVLAAFPDTVTQRGVVTSKPGHIYGGGAGLPSHTGLYGFDDKGSAARYFYTAKADKQDRWGSLHPTVKPINLIRWLVRLVTPPGGLVLDPFAGSGTTGAAAFAEGRNAILIEREDAYVADIRERMAWYEGGGVHSTQAKNRNRGDGVGALRDGNRDRPVANIGPLFERPYDEAADLAGSYYAAIEEIGHRVKAGEPVPECMLKQKEP